MNRLLSLFLLIAVVLISCSKETGDGDGSQQAELTLNVGEARPLQLLSVAVTGVSPQLGSYNGTIGDVQVEFHTANAQSFNSLVCLVPENVGMGIQTVTLELDNLTLSSNVNILPNETVGTPEDVFDQFYADYTTADYEAFIDENELQIALDDIRALPESDRLIAAQMLANNRVVLDNIAQIIADAEAQTGLGFGKTQSCDMLCVIGAAAAVVGAFVTAPIGTAVGLGILAGYVARALKPVVSALWNKVVTGIVAAVRLGYDRMAYVTELVYDEADQMISNKVEEVPDTIYLENGRPLKLAIKTVREPIISENNRAQYTEVGVFLDAYYLLQNFLAGTEYQVPGLQSGEVEDFALDLDDFSISVDNPLVTVSEITGTPELAEVVFDSPQQGAHIFNFTYSYVNDEGTESNFTQTARLLNISTFGNWSGAGSSFSATNDQDLVSGVAEYDGNVNAELRIWIGDRTGSTLPEYTGVKALDELWFQIDGYDGPGTYTPYNSSTSTGIRQVSIFANGLYDYDTDQFVEDNLCWYTENGNMGEGIGGSVNITNEEFIGPLMVLDGEFTIVVTSAGSQFGDGNCSFPASVSGSFRIAVDVW